MRVISKVFDREVDGVYFVDIHNYYGRRLCWYVRAGCESEDACKKCDFYSRPICFELTCSKRGSCYKCVHEGDLLVSCEGYRVYIVVKEGPYLKARLATRVDFDSDHQLHRISSGVYLYRGNWIRNLGYYEPDKREVWEAEEINNQGLEATAHGFTLDMCRQELDIIV